MPVQGIGIVYEPQSPLSFQPKCRAIIKDWRNRLLKRIALLVTTTAMAAIIAFTAHASGQADQAVAPIFGITIPPDYRNWRLISVAHEAGNLNDLRAVLGN